MQIPNIKQAEQLLANYIPVTKEITGKDITLERIRPLMALVGNPQDKLRVVHLAGTSGKTSTAYYLTDLLEATGKKTGLSVSPHISSVTERVQLHGKPLEEKEFCDALGEFMELIKKTPLMPSYFELLIAFAFWYFHHSGVDYAVMETGLGGLHDATNIAQRADKICIITDIGIDHTRILGSTVEQIASQKAGIIHKGNQVFMNTQPPHVVSVFKQRCVEVGATLHLQSNIPAHPDMPEYQARNWSLAKFAFDSVRDRDALANPSADQLLHSRQLQVPGRMDSEQTQGHTITFDGAHNEQKLTAFVNSYTKIYPPNPLAVVAFKKDKDYWSALRILRNLTNRLIITKFSKAQDIPALLTPASMLAEHAERLGFEIVGIEPDPHAALRLALAQPDDFIVVTGSLYLVAELKQETYEKN